LFVTAAAAAATAAAAASILASPLLRWAGLVHVCGSSNSSSKFWLPLYLGGLG
jgi:hypothetical protein